MFEVARHCFHRPRLPPCPRAGPSSHTCRHILVLHSFAVFCTRAKRISLFFNPFRTLHKNTRVSPRAFFNSSTLNFSTSAPPTPLSATLTADLRVLPCFGRNRPPATPLDATLTEARAVTPLSATLTKNGGGGRGICFSLRNLASRPASATNFARLQQGAVIYSRRIDLLSAGVALG